MNSKVTTNIPCPRCDGQGYVFAARVNATGQLIFVCDECEAMWLAADDISHAGHADFGSYMQGQGLAPLWSEITLLNEGGARHNNGMHPTPTRCLSWKWRGGAGDAGR